MANEDKGRVKCPFSGTSAAVRRNSKGRLYFNCPSCGVIQPHGAGFQSWMMDNAVLYGPDGKPEVETPPVPSILVEVSRAAPPEKKPEEKPAPAVPVAPVAVEKKTEGKPAIDGWAL